MRRKDLTTLVYSAAHLIVDMGCAFLMYFWVRSTGDWHMSVLLYNFMAFAMQLPLGLLADKLSRNWLFALIGCLAVAGAFMLNGSPIAAAIVAGIGNSLFHIGGGIEVMNLIPGKSSLLGIFVSTGAIGLYAGAWLGGYGQPAAVPVAVSLVLTGSVIAWVQLGNEGDVSSHNVPFDPVPEGGAKALLPLLCLFIVVCIRSYTGLAMYLPWKKGYLALGVVLASAIGKASGGFLADRAGAKGASLMSLTGAAVLFLFSSRPVAGILAVLLFNMTMPVTLWATSRILKGARGFAFGMMTFGLFLGFIPIYLNLWSPLQDTWSLTASAAVSLLFLLMGLRRRVK